MLSLLMVVEDGIFLRQKSAPVPRKVLPVHIKTSIIDLIFLLMTIAMVRSFSFAFNYLSESEI